MSKDYSSKGVIPVKPTDRTRRRFGILLRRSGGLFHVQGLSDDMDSVCGKLNVDLIPEGEFRNTHRVCDIGVEIFEFL